MVCSMINLFNKHTFILNESPSFLFIYLISGQLWIYISSAGTSFLMGLQPRGVGASPIEVTFCTIEYDAWLWYWFLKWAGVGRNTSKLKIRAFWHMQEQQTPCYSGHALTFGINDRLFGINSQ